MIKQLFLSILMLTVFITFIHAEELIKLDFNNYPDGPILANKKWQVHMPENNKKASTYTIEKGQLKIIINSAKNLHGGYIETDIPIIRKGILEFDLNVNHNKKGIGLFIDFYNISLFWHDYTKDWRRYFPEPTAKRITGYEVEPVGHRQLSKVDKKRWARYKIYFNVDDDVVEYYKDDMENPVYIDGAAAVLGRQEYLGGKLRIGSWGVTGEPMKFLIDNITISTVVNKYNKNSLEREQYLIFNGMSHNRYKISEILSANGINKKNIKNFYIENPKPALSPVNKFFLDKLPGTASMKKAKALIFVDCPLGPGDIVPSFVIKNAIENVKQGMTMVIFGGLFTLGKGEFQGTELEQFLPVKLKDVWRMKGDKTPLFIKPFTVEYKNFHWSDKPIVYYYHNLEPTKDAKVLLMAGNKSLLVSRKLGKGKIIVFLGTTNGPQSNIFKVFWKWHDWNKLAFKIIN